MSELAERLKTEALGLPSEDRAELAYCLIRSLDEGDDPALNPRGRRSWSEDGRTWRAARSPASLLIGFSASARPPPVKPVLLHDDAVAELHEAAAWYEQRGRDWGQNFGRRSSGPFPGFAAIRRPARPSGPLGSAPSWSVVFPTSLSLPKAGRQSASWPLRTHGAGRAIGLDGHGTEDRPPLFTRNWRSSGELGMCRSGP